MEHQPHNPEDRDTPERERLWPGEIDLTGVVEQEDALSDVIGDAISEVEGTDDEVPEWGARTLARALANQLDEPQSGALHHFAVTGRADKEAIGIELAGIYQGTADEEVKEWVNRLGTYIIRLPDNDGAETDDDDREQPPALEVPIDGTPLEKVSAYLRIAFAEADKRGEVISPDDAQAIAALLAPLLPPNSEMHRFAETGDAHPAQIHEECQQLKGRKWQTEDIGTWVVHLEQHLATRTDLGRQAEATEHADKPQVAEGIREHGNAFRAFLELPDTDPGQADLLERFHAFYVGAYASMEALLAGLTEINEWQQAVSELEGRLGIGGYVTLDHAQIEHTVREAWDIVKIDETFYVFDK